MENGESQLVLHVPSAPSSHGTVEFTGVSPEREQPVTPSPSPSLVRSDCAVGVDGAVCEWMKG